MNTPTPVQLTDIESHAKRLADARADLKDVVGKLNSEVEALKRSCMPAIKRAVAKTAERHLQLSQLIESSPGLFVRPRTMIFHGVKVGLAKGKGTIEWDDDDKLVKLIKRNHPDQVDLLIKTTEKPLKKALNQLASDELRKLGVRVEETGDVVVISFTDSETDKIVAALLKDATEDEDTEVKEAA